MMAVMCSDLFVAVAQNTTEGSAEPAKVRYPCWEKGFKLRLDLDAVAAVTAEDPQVEAAVVNTTLSLDYQINTLVQAGLFGGAIWDLDIADRILGIPVGIDVRAYAGRCTRRVRLFYAAQVGILVKGHKYENVYWYNSFNQNYMNDTYGDLPCISKFEMRGEPSMEFNAGKLFTKLSFGFECRSGFHLGAAAQLLGMDRCAVVRKKYFFEDGTSIYGKYKEVRNTALHPWQVGITMGWNISITRPKRNLYL